MNALIFIGLVSSASALSLDLSKEAVEKSNEGYMRILQKGMSTEAAGAQSALMAELDKYTTEEGQMKTFQTVIDTDAMYIKEAAQEMEWFGDIAKDGVVDLGDGTKFPVLDDSAVGRLPKGLPEFPTDPADRAKFISLLPVDAGMYSTMLALKKDPTKLVAVAQDDLKKNVASLLQEQEDTQEPSATALLQKKAEEKHLSTIEMLKAAPKEFKKALKMWEKAVPEVATILLQTSTEESESQAMDLAETNQKVHQALFQSLEKVTGRAELMTVAQNRITSLLIKQAYEKVDALEGCTGDFKEFAGAHARCLCVADNICHYMQHSTSGNMCTIASASTCMAPVNQEENDSMMTV